MVPKGCAFPAAVDWQSTAVPYYDPFVLTITPAPEPVVTQKLIVTSIPPSDFPNPVMSQTFLRGVALKIFTKLNPGSQHK